MLTLAHRAACLLFGLFMTAAAFVQLNDPDPVFWITLYGLDATMMLATAAGKNLKPQYAAALAVVFLYFATYYAVTSSPQLDQLLTQEVGREVMGLLLGFFSSAVLALWLEYRNNSPFSPFFVIAVIGVAAAAWLSAHDMEADEPHCAGMLTA